MAPTPAFCESAPLSLLPRLGIAGRLLDGGLDPTFGRPGRVATTVQGHSFGSGDASVAIFGLVGLPDGGLIVGAEARVLRFTGP